jgi:hypothetical protein
MAEGKTRLVADIDPAYHEKLVQRTLKRSVELGRKVGMGVVIQEMLDREEQLERDDPSVGLFASQD